MLGRLGRARSLVCVAMLVAGAAEGATFTVNRSDDVDDGQCDPAHCSLREAIRASEALEGRDTIDFLLEPADGRVHRIQPTAPLPTLSDPAGVEIRGLSQPGSMAATTSVVDLTLGAVVRVEIGGALAGPAASGLVIADGRAGIDGLAIHGFSGTGIHLAGGGAHEIVNVFAGTDASGAAPIPNGGDGIRIETPDCVVRDGMFSANGGAGIRLGAGASRTRVMRNLVGSSADGQTRLGNAASGITVESDGNQIGADSGQAINYVRANGGAGIVLTGTGAHSNWIRSNTLDENESHGVLVREGARENSIATGMVLSFRSPGSLYRGNGGNAIRIAASAGPDNLALPAYVAGNGGIAIDLEGGVEDEDGATQNDAGDADEGPNDLLNHPLLLSARRCAIPPSGQPTSICVEVEYSGSPNQDIAPVFFTGVSCDSLAATVSALFLQTDSNGEAREGGVIRQATSPFFSTPHTAIAVMATDFPTRRSSELSACVAIEPASTPTIGSPTPTALPPTATPVPPTGTSTPTIVLVTPPPTSTVSATRTAIVPATPTPTGSTPTTPGDANCDGCVSAADLIDAALQRAADELRCGSDLASDGKVDEQDRAALTRALFVAHSEPCGPNT